MLYKAFISYSHGTDYGFAVALEAALQRFALPANGQPAIRLFRDASNLSATPELWPTIQEALEGAEFLVLIASEESAKSRWVNQEVEYWRAHGQPGHLVLALTTGKILWDGERGDFDFAKSTALPPSISGAFRSEPLYVDFNGLLPQHYDLNHPVFCDKVAMIASTLRGVSKDELFGLHVSQRIAAEAARLSAEAELALRDGFPERSLLLGGAALKMTDDRGESRAVAAESVVRSALSRFGGRLIGSLADDAVSAPLAFDKNGRWLATIDPEGHASARKLNVSDIDGKVVALVQDFPITKIEFTADDRWLVSQSTARPGIAIRFWDAQSDFSEWHDISTPEGKAVACAILSVERTHLIAGCDDGTILVWDLQDGGRSNPLVTLNARNAVRLVACAAKQKRVAAVAGDVLGLWNLGGEQGTHREVFLEGARTFQLAISPDGNWVLCQGQSSFLLPFGQDGQPGGIELTAYRGRIWKHSFSDDSRWLVTATGPTAYEELVQAYYPEFTVRLWDLHRRKSWDLLGHEEVVCDVAITPDGNRVLSTSLDRTIRLWDFSLLRRFQEERMKHEAEGDASSAQNVPGGDLDAHESYVAQQAFRDHKVLLGGEEAVFHCVPSPDGKWMATVGIGKSKSARLWRIENGFGASPIELPKIATPDGLAWIDSTQKWLFYAVLGRASGGTAEFSAGREWLILWVSGHLLVFDVLHDRSAAFWKLDVPFESARLSPDGGWLAIRTQTKVVVTSLRDSQLLRDVSGETEPIDQVHFSACGRWLITVEGIGAACVRDLRSAEWKTLETLRVESSQPLNVAIDQKGRLLFAGGNGGVGTVWELDNTGHASVFMEVTGHAAQNISGSIYGQFTADGRWLLTSDLGLLQVWDLATRKLRFQVVEENVKTGFSAAMTSDGRWLVVSKYGRLMLFDMQEPDGNVVPVVVREYGAGRIQFALSADSRWLVASDVPFDSPASRMGPPLERMATPSARVYDLWAANVAGSFVALPGLGSEAQKVDISWDSRWLATTGASVKLWPLGVPHLLEIASQTAGRDFTDDERSRHMVE